MTTHIVQQTPSRFPDLFEHIIAMAFSFTRSSPVSLAEAVGKAFHLASRLQRKLPHSDLTFEQDLALGPESRTVREITRICNTLWAMHSGDDELTADQKDMLPLYRYIKQTYTIHEAMAIVTSWGIEVAGFPPVKVDES